MKVFKKIVVGFTAALLALSATACAERRKPNEPTITVDNTKTQLSVSLYGSSGFGTSWLLDVAKDFEAKYDGVSLEEGKVGVQIIPNSSGMTNFNDKTKLDATSDHLFFTEGSNYLRLVSEGALEDISDVVTEIKGSDGKIIETKLTGDQKDFYKHSDGKYYGLPHYTGQYGLVYNKTLFEEEHWFFGANGEIGGYVDDKKSHGPDGKPNTFDDGLPSTYEEFYSLIDYINNTNNTPLALSGKYYGDYGSKFIDALAANYEGAEQYRLNYTFNGTAKNLVTGIDPITTEEKVITTANYYDLASQAGKYYAFTFADKITAGKRENPKYFHQDLIKGTSDHLAAQKKFANREAAMLIDGNWWYNESKSDREGVTDEFGWMPFPHATDERYEQAKGEDKPFVFADNLISFACVKKGIDDVHKKLAKEFLTYFYSDEVLVKFTKHTNVLIGVDYIDALNAEIESNPGSISGFSKDVIAYLGEAEVVYQASNNSFFRLNKDALEISRYYAISNEAPFTAFFKDQRTDGSMAKEWFNNFKTKTKGLKLNG